MALKLKKLEYVLIALLLLYIVMDVSIPSILAQYVDTTIGTILLLSGALYVFHSNKVVGAVVIIAVIELLRRTNGISSIKQYVPSELRRSSNLSIYNQFPISLEEEIVRDQLPHINKIYTDPSFKPKQTTLHAAAEL